MVIKNRKNNISTTSNNYLANESVFLKMGLVLTM